MTIGNPIEWLAQVSNRCRRMTEIAVIAVRDADDKMETRQITLTATQIVLRSHLEGLAELLPEDFPSSRLGDLGRHIHFCQLGDCIDIAAFDIPDILEKAEQYALSHQPDRHSGEIGDYLHPVYRARLERELATAEPDYHGLVAKACILLGDAFKFKARVANDRDAEIGRAFKLEDPVIQVPSQLVSETDKNFQRGTMLLMQGVRAFYRNTHLHGQLQTTQRQAVHALIVISLLNEILDAAHRKDEGLV